MEVAAGGTVVWQYPSVLRSLEPRYPGVREPTPSGNTLITDSNNRRILEVDSASPPKIVWMHKTATRTTQRNTGPTRAIRLANGHTLIAEPFTDQVVEIDGTPQQNIVYVHGGLGVAGKGTNELNQAYDAKVVGDFTGLTPPSL